jgi:hypothetical protein
MSKRRARKQPAAKAKGKVPAADLSVRLAGIRWYLLAIEGRALELILKNPAAYAVIQPVLSEAWKGIKQITVPTFLAGCPPPWKLCDDECRPECDDVRFGEFNEE